MAETGQAQNKLGKLFVDIGVGGLGQTLKALNSVSARFLLTKNAATQAIKPFVDMGMQAANSAVGVGKMASALATTKLNAQKLRYFLKEKGVEGLEGDIARIQKMYGDYAQRVGGISTQYAYALERVGLHWQNYNGDFKSTLKLIQDIQKSEKFKGFSDVEQLSLLNQMGLSSEWKYLFERADFDLNQVLAISDDQIEKEIDLAESIKKLQNSTDQLKQKVVSIFIEKGLIEKLDSLIDKLDRYIKSPKDFKNDTINAAKNPVNYVKALPAVSIGTYLGNKIIENWQPGNKTIANGNLLPLTDYSALAPAAVGKPSDVPQKELTPQGITIKQDINVNAPDGYQVTEDAEIRDLNNNLQEIEFNNSINRNGKSR